MAPGAILGASRWNLVGILFRLCHSHSLPDQVSAPCNRMCLGKCDCWCLIYDLFFSGSFLIENSFWWSWSGLLPDLPCHSTCTPLLSYCLGDAMASVASRVHWKLPLPHQASTLDRPSEPQLHHILLSAHLLHLAVTWALQSHYLPSHFHYVPFRTAVRKTKFLPHSLPQLFHMNKSNFQIKY